MSSLLSGLAIGLALLSLLLKLQLPFLRSKRPLVVYLKQKSILILIFSWIVLLIDIILTTFDFYGEITFFTILFLSVAFLFIRTFVFYDKIYPTFRQIDKLDKSSLAILHQDPEVAVLSFKDASRKNEVNFVYPLAMLRFGDIVYKSTADNVPS